jgi:ATP-dependent Lon protease
MAIGGVKEKLLAAHRCGIKTILLPKDNEKDYVDVPEEVRKELTVHFVETIDEVLILALEKQCPLDASPIETPQLWITPPGGISNHIE